LFPTIPSCLSVHFSDTNAPRKSRARQPTIAAASHALSLAVHTCRPQTICQWGDEPQPRLRWCKGCQRYAVESANNATTPPIVRTWRGGVKASNLRPVRLSSETLSRMFSPDARSHIDSIMGRLYT